MSKEIFTIPKDARLSQKAKAVQENVQNAIVAFCEQCPEFERAVYDGGKSFKDCLEHVVAGSGSCLSDIAAYRRAAQFYFPTAVVDFQMVIRSSEHDDLPAGEMLVDLNDFL